MQQNYEVIRFVQQNGKYHIIIDYVEGELLCNYLRREKHIDKERVFQLLLLLAKELICLEKSDGEDLFPYLTPMHIVIKKDQTLAFLKSNETHNRIQLFIPLDGTKDYIYSYGRTVQFLLASIECVPDLTRKEERKLKKIISKCLKSNSKKQYQSGQDIVDQLYPMKKKYILRTILLCTILSLSVLGMKNIKQAPEEEKASNYQLLKAYLQDEKYIDEEEIKHIVSDYRSELQEEFSVAQLEFLFRVYQHMDSEYGNEEALKIGDRLLEKIVDCREIIANMYLQQNETEKAAKEYEVLLKENPTVERYQVLTDLFEKNGRHEEAMRVCKEGCIFDPDGSILQLQYVRLLLMNSEYSVHEKKSELEEFLSMYPKVSELNEYKILEKEIGIEEKKDED